jgi:hypothetical protein
LINSALELAISAKWAQLRELFAPMLCDTLGVNLSEGKWEFVTGEASACYKQVLDAVGQRPNAKKRLLPELLPLVPFPFCKCCHKIDDARFKKTNHNASWFCNKLV